MNRLLPDSIIEGRYRIVKQIGQGGFGAVYEAIDLRLNNRVALKQLLLAGDDINRAFRREAELLANLRHAALPKVFDFFTDDLGQFLVMEYIGGDDLAALLQQRDVPFPVHQTLDWAEQLLSVLAYLHTRTPPILHRDIKPQNLKLTSSNEIVLLDFGLAKGSVSGAPGTSAMHSIRAYTPGYAPLEQMHGQGTTPQSDLYALAATLYYLLTRSVPPESTARASELLRRYPDPLSPLHEKAPTVPAAVSDVLMGALAIHAEDRPASAMAMRTALVAARQVAVEPAPPVLPSRDIPVVPEHTVIDTTQPRPSTASGRTRMMSWTTIAGSLFVIVLLVALLWRPLLGNRDPGVVAGGTTAQPTETAAAVAAASATVPPQTTTTSVPAMTEAPLSTSVSEATERPTATVRTGIAVPTVTANPAVTEAPSAAVGRIAFTANEYGSSEIFVMDADGSNRTRLTVNDLNVTDHSPAWSPDGERIVYVSALADYSSLFVMNADGSGKTQLTEDETFKSQPVWSPDGRRIAFVSGNTGDSSIQVMNADGSNRYELAENQAGDHSPAWSPDGVKLLYVAERDGTQEIILKNADGTGGSQLTGDGQFNYGMEWSPDGRKIVYVAGGFDDAAIYVMNADGNGQTRLTAPADRDDSPHWSPDGERIVFTSRRSGRPEVYVMNRNGGAQTALGETADAYTPQWSPDGRRIAFGSDRDEDANIEIYTANPNGTDMVRLTNQPGIADAPVWMPQN